MSCYCGGMQVSPALRVFCSSKRHSFQLGGMGTQGVCFRVPPGEGSRDRILGKED